MSELQCCGESLILAEMRDAQSVRNGFTPRDTPALVIMLANHRRRCATCQGVPLEEQLFGCQVAISASRMVVGAGGCPPFSLGQTP